jgi:predicted Zn-dependent protease
LQLDLLESLRADGHSFPPAQQRRLTRLEAQALAAGESPRRALDLLRAEVAKHPDDYSLNRALAEMLSEQEDAESLRSALQRWRSLARGLREGSPRWWEAKENVARLHLRLGNPKQTRKMIELLSILRPDLGGPESKARFQSLLRRTR